jgi:putative hydrolase of the HAD superfamily
LHGRRRSTIFAAMQGAAEKTGVNSAPDLRHVESWIFDLDHTLYVMDAARHTMVEERICLFVQRHFRIAREPAWEIQKRYLREHGSTLGGLVRHHGVDADTYHDFVNDIVALDLSRDLLLRAGLARLPGRRIVFTNNCGRFARDVLARIVVDDLFADIVDARATNFVPKPLPDAYETLIARTGVAPRRSALFDDSPRNLVPAKALGMTTIWLNNGQGQSHWTIDNAERYIDHRTDDIASFLHSIRI